MICCKIDECRRIYELLEEFTSSFYEPLEKRSIDLREYAEKLSKNAEVYIAEISGAAAGLICFYCNDTERKEGYLASIAVKEAYRKRGIASALLQIMYKQCKEKGMKTIRLEVNVKNDRAICLYEKQGWTRLTETGKSACYMVRNI